MSLSCINDIPTHLEIGINSKKCFLCKELKYLSEYDPDNRKYQLKPDLHTCKVCKKCDLNRALEELSIVKYNFEESKFEVITFENKNQVIEYYGNKF
jgi:hypothetical protein